LGETHPDYLITLHNLGVLYSAKGEPDKAASILRQVLAQKLAHKDEVHAAVTVTNLANVCRATGNYAEAEGLERKALEIYKRTVGARHPEYAECLSGLAIL
jgi:tetratricopeptide (TPR) repeat protein